MNFLPTSPAPFDYKGSNVLITGASRGIGAAFARALASRGVAGLVLTARSTEELNALADELRRSHAGLRVETIRANLAEPHAPARIREETDRLGLPIDLLVNNAGFGAHGPFEEVGADKDEDMVAVNVAAVVALTHLYYPDMLRRARGGVINVASTAAFQPVPFMTTYGATKAFVLSFSEGLWAECRDQGLDAMRVVCLCPGDTQTSFGEGMHRGRFEGGKQSTPEEVAEAGLDALDRDLLYHVVGTGNYLNVMSARLIPRRTSARIVAGLMRPVGQTKPGTAASRSTSLAVAVGTGLAAAATIGTVYLLRRRGGGRSSSGGI